MKIALPLGLALSCVLLPDHAKASPALRGTRNLSMGDATRASSAGIDGMLINPAALSYTRQFSIRPSYQLSVRDRMNGIGLYLGDSLNNPHFALGIGYTFMRGTPRVGYTNPDGENKELELQHFGHEAMLNLSVTAVPNWLYLGLKAKYQYTSLRFLDDDDKARNARPKLNAFGLDTGLALNFFNWARVAAVGYNLAGHNTPAWTEADPLALENVATEDGSELDTSQLRRISDYPLAFAHGLAIFPLGRPDFSLNFDGYYDFNSYRDTKDTRMVYSGAAEFVLRAFPLRVGGYWDGRGPGKADDRGYISAGSGFIKPASVGGVGIDFGLGFSQQVTGQGPLDTTLGLHISIRLHPDL